MFIALGVFETTRLIFSQLGVNNGCSLAIMRSCKIVRHLLREAGASTEKNDLPDRAAARIVLGPRAQVKRVLVLCTLRTVLAVETNLPVSADHAILMCAISTNEICVGLAPSVRRTAKGTDAHPLAPSMACAVKGVGVNLPVQHAAIPKAETAQVAIPAIPLLVVVAARTSAKCVWAREVVASVRARVRALVLLGWLIVSLRLLCRLPR